jgi:hypothetical protein
VQDLLVFLVQACNFDEMAPERKLNYNRSLN